MTHYEKLATMIFRVAGAVAFLHGLVNTVISYYIASEIAPLAKIILVSSHYIIIGIGFFVFSKSLAKLVCLGLGNKDE